MSVRTFTRRFRDEVGVTPGQWLTARRVAVAMQLPEVSDLSVDLIADRTGFGGADSLRQPRREVLGAPPAARRRTFRAVAADRDGGSSPGRKVPAAPPA